MSGSNTVYLVTGANRGLGRGLTEALLGRPSTTVIATVRDVNHPTAQSLKSVPAAGSNSRVVLVKIDSKSLDDPAKAMADAEAQGITKIDVAIANAGIANYYGPAATTPLAEVQEHFSVNVLGVLALFQAAAPLLQRSAQPKFVAVSSGAGSIGDMDKLPMENTAYGASKAALNFVVRKIHFENPWLVTFPISPGWVQTDMGNAGATAAGLEQAPTTLAESVAGQLRRIDGATREETGGEFVSFDGAKYNW